MIERVQDYDGVVLVAKGALTYLPHFDAFAGRVSICWWSRFTYPDDKQWLTVPPAARSRLLLFDRSVTTGVSVQRVRCWLAEQEYTVDVLGQLDPLCRMGIHYVDYVLQDGQAVPKDRFLAENPGACRGEYAFVLEGPSGETKGIPAPRPLPPKNGLLTYAEIRSAALNLDAPGDLLLCADSHWSLGELLVLTHVIRKPLVRVGDYEGSDLSTAEFRALWSDLDGER